MKYIRKSTRTQVNGVHQTLPGTWLAGLAENGGVEDFYVEGVDKCYLLDFVGPKGFSTKLSQKSIYRDHVETVLKYIEEADLRRWRLPEIHAFRIGLGEWRSKFNYITNPYMYEQLLDISSADLLAKGNLYISSCQIDANKFLVKAFKVRLGRGFYAQFLGVRADGNSDLSDENGKQLSLKSTKAGLRPIGAVIYRQRNNLKMCLSSTDTAIDTSEVAKAYGGVGCPNSSSFIIRMDEYNQWLSGNV
ncbi:hypothetical protein CRYUN_Cryun04dG0070800 [Craigia yunnanensis]